VNGAADHPPNQGPALLVSGLRKAYGDVVAVDGLNLEVRRGECFGLLGPNGAGKTTTIEIAVGLNRADAGEIAVLGRRWDRRADERELRQRIGLQLQETLLAEKLTVRETMELFASFYRNPRAIDEVIGLVDLHEKQKARVGQLSGGQKQRLAVACALAGDPELLVLDEPTTGLDPQARRQLWDLIEQFRRTGRTILLTTHYMDEAERLCDRVAVVDHGKVIALGTPRELIASLGGLHVVAFSIDGDPATLDATLFDEVPGITASRIENGTWSLQVKEPHAAIPAVMAAVARRGRALTELSTHSATLEDVFVTLTGRHLREQ
jgi:ABC-2 type transport system ATP-binding protein